MMSEMSATQTGSKSAPDLSAGRLRANSFGLSHVLFQSITHMAPLPTLTFVAASAVGLSGPALPFAIVFAALAALCVATAIGQMAKDIPSAGGLYSYVSAGLGPAAGFLVGWAFLLIEPLVAPLLFLLCGFEVADVLSTSLGIHISWMIPSVITALVVLALNYRDVRMSLMVGMILGACEIIVILALAAWMIYSNADHLTLAPFNPFNSADGSLGSSFKAVVFVAALYIGFEAAAPLGEEARRPTWTVPRALIYSVIGMCIVYVIFTYAWVIGTGFDVFTSVTTSPDNPNPLMRIATTFWGAGWILLFAATINGVFANANASVNTGARVTFAMARNHVLPRALARTHPIFQTPHIAIVSQIVFGLVCAILLGSATDPITGVIILGLLIAIAAIAVYCTVCVATIVYFLKGRRQGRPFNVWLHVVVPAIGAVFFLVPLYYQYSPLPDYPIRWANWLPPVWGVIGVFVYMVISRRNARLGRDVSQIFVADPNGAAD